ncbi:heparinase II/III family protein [Actibacterium sp. XHP0104]|uniref:heparinase II/III family protein n=1 Tax=Actibacterium sp. XHP0104 TaxID=2984335 RepID=UPI0021E7FB24|nr:heparinase II/III family protein [Actibacterium sp. XHP0104]MCV2881924.1 heparinase II/III family protein [Actibacterium sp. XHP0104]
MAGQITTGNWTARCSGYMNRLQARMSSLARPAGGFVSQPEPRTIGGYARGKQLISGNYLFAGYLVEAPGAPVWDVPPPSLAFEEEIHGFRWLDDLAAVGDGAARKQAQAWIATWIDRYGNGTGVGWTPDLTGRRIIRWINHAIFLLAGQEKSGSQAYFRSLGQQTIFLSRRWKAAAPGLPRFEALTGLIYAGLALQGMGRHVAPAARALARECRQQIDAQGGIPTRNPEELLEVFTLLSWAASALEASGQTPPAEHVDAIRRIAPTLRTLRHSDGGLARFHGGGRGAEGRLDHALAASRIKTPAADGLAMGYARLSAGRSSVIIDAAAPPTGAASYNAHASTLAFELTSGRRPVIVNCGSGVSFGEDWRRAGRATGSHSTLEIAGYSSSRLAPRRQIGGHGRELLADAPRKVRAEREAGPQGQVLSGWHDGYARTHGLVHARQLSLSPDGRMLTGEDTLAALTDDHLATFDAVMTRSKLQGVVYKLRFHLHPDVDAALDMGGNAVSLALKSGEIWVFRHDGHAELMLEPSVYLETGRLKPRASRQIVLSSRVLMQAGQLNWTLAKAQDTPQAIRDLVTDDDPLPEEN